jgi:hypothetical protein
LLDFTRDHVVGFTEDADKEIRQAAVLACAKVSWWPLGEQEATTVLSFVC